MGTQLEMTVSQVCYAINKRRKTIDDQIDFHRPAKLKELASETRRDWLLRIRPRWRPSQIDDILTRWEYYERYIRGWNDLSRIANALAGAPDSRMMVDISDVGTLFG